MKRREEKNKIGSPTLTNDRLSTASDDHKSLTLTEGSDMKTNRAQSILGGDC